MHARRVDAGVPLREALAQLDAWLREQGLIGQARVGGRGGCGLGKQEGGGTWHCGFDWSTDRLASSLPPPSHPQGKTFVPAIWRDWDLKVMVRGGGHAPAGSRLGWRCRLGAAAALLLSPLRPPWAPPLLPLPSMLLADVHGDQVAQDRAGKGGARAGGAGEQRRPCARLLAYRRASSAADCTPAHPSPSHATLPPCAAQVPAALD